MTTVLNAEAIGAPTQLMIDGRWVDASDGKTFDVDDPATGEVIATVADASVEDGLAAVSAASAALPAWSATPPRQRAEVLRRTFELMTAACRRLRAADRPRERQGADRRARRGRLRGGVLPLVCGGGGARGRPRADRACRHQPDSRAAPADRGERPDHAMELPGGDGDPQDRTGAGGGMHRRAQAGVGHAADRACHGGAARGSRRPCGRCQRPAVAALRRRSSPQCSTTRACASSRSRARPRSAAVCCSRRPTAS